MIECQCGTSCFSGSAFSNQVCLFFQHSFFYRFFRFCDCQQPNGVKIAMFGDNGVSSNAVSVLNLVKSEGTLIFSSFGSLFFGIFDFFGFFFQILILLLKVLRQSCWLVILITLEMQTLGKVRFK